MKSFLDKYSEETDHSLRFGVGVQATGIACRTSNQYREDFKCPLFKHLEAICCKKHQSIIRKNEFNSPCTDLSFLRGKRAVYVTAWRTLLTGVLHETVKSASCIYSDCTRRIFGCKKVYRFEVQTHSATQHGFLVNS